MEEQITFDLESIDYHNNVEFHGDADRGARVRKGVVWCDVSTCLQHDHEIHDEVFRVVFKFGMRHLKTLRPNFSNLSSTVNELSNDKDQKTYDLCPNACDNKRRRWIRY